MITVNEITNAMGGGLFVICATLLGLTFEAQGSVPWLAALGSVLFFVVLAFTSFGLMHNNLTDLFDVADRGVTHLNDISNSHQCPGDVAQAIVGQLISEKVQMILECAQPVLDNREGLFATYAGSLAAVTFVLTFGVLRSPGFVMTIARIGSICLLVSFIALLCLGIITEFYMSYKDEYATEVASFIRTTDCCQNYNGNVPQLVDCLILGVTNESLLGADFTGCWDTVVHDVCGVSSAVHQLWDLNSNTTQAYIIFALLSVAVAGSLACLILGHSKSLYPTPRDQFTLKEGLITFFVFWALIGLAAAIWQSAYKKMHLLWLVWLSPVVCFIIVGLISRYMRTSQTNFSSLVKVGFL